MLVAVVHAGGAKAAQEQLARLYGSIGSPDVMVSSGGGIVAGWRASAPLGSTSEGLVEGWLDTDAPDRPFGWDYDVRLARARGDFAALALGCGGVIAASGPGGGHRPLFVAARPDWVAASTRLRSLVGVLEARPRLDLDYLAATAALESPLALSATPYVGLHRVPLGEAWLLRVGMTAQRRSILLDLPHEEVIATDDENASLLRGAIESATARSTRAATTVGVTLSGGLDSSSVLATVENLRRLGRVSANVEAFAFEFDTSDPGDDRPFRRSMERRFGIRTNAIAPSEAAPFVRRGMVLDAMPCTDCPSPLWIALDRAAQSYGINRILTGAGGDNVLEGDPTLLGEVAWRGNPMSAVRTAIRLRVGYTSQWSRVRAFVMRPIVRAMTPERFRAIYRRRASRRWLDWMGPHFDGWLRDRRAYNSASAPAVTLKSSPAERYCALARMPFLADVVLLRGQQEEATQYHRSDPLFDDEVLRVVASLPPLALFAGGYARGLLRQSMADLLPPEVRTRLKKAYMDPALAQMVAAAGGFGRLEDLARVRRLADLGLVEPKAFRKHFDRMAKHPLDGVWSSAWPALAVEEFLRQYDEGWELW